MLFSRHQKQKEDYPHVLYVGNPASCSVRCGGDSMSAALACWDRWCSTHL